MTKDFNKVFETMNKKQIESILDAELSKHLNFYPSDDLELVHKEVKNEGSLTYLNAQYHRKNTNTFNLLYFKIVTFNDRPVLFDSNVLYYNKDTFKPLTMESLKEQFKGFLNHLTKLTNH